MIADFGVQIAEYGDFQKPMTHKAKPFEHSTFHAFLVILFLLFPPVAGADDVGITKARLIQKSERSYVLEADVPRRLVWAIKAPVFPDRFQVSELEYIRQSGWVVVQATASTKGNPLSPKDEILLPWMRNGADLTVRWLDGSVYQGLFLRSLDGIHVPIRLLMPVKQSLGVVCREHFLTGIKHLTFYWIHLILAGALALAAPSRQLLKAFLYYLFGQALSIVAVDVGLSGFDLLFTDILGLILIFIISLAAVRRQTIRPYFPLICLFGFLHGLSYGQELLSLDLTGEQRLAGLFMFESAVDIGLFLAAGLVWLTAKVFQKTETWRRPAAYGSGVLSVAMLMLLFQTHVVAGKTDLFDFSKSPLATRFALPASQKMQTGGQRPKGARRLTAPVMLYLSVMPYEVRLEVLIQARAAVQFLGVPDEGMGSIPKKSLIPVKKGLLGLVLKSTPVSIEGQQAQPVLTRADFVTLGPAGVTVRKKPEVESLDQGIVGLTLVYETPNLADMVSLSWRLFSETVEAVAATTTDPFGTATMILSPDQNELRWKSRLSGYRVPVIDEITVEKERLPIPSLLLFLVAAGLFLVSFRKRGRFLGRPIILSIAALAFLLYPFSRFSVDLPVVSGWTPSAARTSAILEGLLTNVYRAFDVRDENRVYDRLAVTVAGDQLTDIFLQNRKSMELENRGGARANVDDLEILAVNGVKKNKDGGFVADAVWTVSGSVSHFGHTHYRRNKNRALVTFVQDDQAWKIMDIELIEEERLL